MTPLSKRIVSGLNRLSCVSLLIWKGFNIRFPNLSQSRCVRLFCKLTRDVSKSLLSKWLNGMQFSKHWQHKYVSLVISLKSLLSSLMHFLRRWYLLWQLVHVIMVSLFVIGWLHERQVLFTSSTGDHTVCLDLFIACKVDHLCYSLSNTIDAFCPWSFACLMIG